MSIIYTIHKIWIDWTHQEMHDTKAKDEVWETLQFYGIYQG